MEPRDGIENNAERGVIDGRLPVDQVTREVGHEDGDRLSSGADAEVWCDEWLDQSHLVAGDDRFAKRDVARGADDPVETRRGALEDEPPIATVESGQRRTGPAVIRERHLGDADEAVPFEELSKRIRGPVSGCGDVVGAV